MVKMLNTGDPMTNENKRRCVIIGGAPIIDYDNIARYLREDDYFIFCDSGLKHLQKLRSASARAGENPAELKVARAVENPAEDNYLVPDLIIGDFDSYDKAQLAMSGADMDVNLADIETIVLPVIKDETDTAFAVSEALRRGFEEFLLIGAIGGRMDHSLVNVSLLYKLYEAGCQAVIVDDYSEMSIVGSEPAYVENTYPFFSLLNMFGPSRDITVTGAKYNLSGAEIKAAEQYASSNEVAPGQTARITVGEGELLLIKVLRDHTDL